MACGGNEDDAMWVRMRIRQRSACGGYSAEDEDEDETENKD